MLLYRTIARDGSSIKLVLYFPLTVWSFAIHKVSGKSLPLGSETSTPATEALSFTSSYMAIALNTES